jgi:hypothetical protein
MAPVSTLRHVFGVAQREHQLVEGLDWANTAYLGIMLRLKALLQHPFRPCTPRKTRRNNVE